VPCRGGVRVWHQSSTAVARGQAGMGMEIPVAPGEGVVGRCRGLGDGGARAGDEWGRD